MPKTDFPDVLDLVKRVKRPELMHSHCFEVDGARLYAAMEPAVTALAEGAEFPELLSENDSLQSKASLVQTLRERANVALNLEDADQRAFETRHMCHVLLDYALHARYPDAEGVAIRVLAPTQD